MVRAREYAQIFRCVMELLDQIYVLLGDETITLKEFAEILEAGFGEIQVGTIPQNVDRVLVGDMERTRLSQVKVLFFLGVNDGNIPKAALSRIWIVNSCGSPGWSWRPVPGSRCTYSGFICI